MPRRDGGWENSACQWANMNPTLSPDSGTPWDGLDIRIQLAAVTGFLCIHGSHGSWLFEHFSKGLVQQQGSDEQDVLYGKHFAAKPIRKLVSAIRPCTRLACSRITLITGAAMPGCGHLRLVHLWDGHL
ncbi:hypothetical protein MGYG_05386 [Nannizzia gypsea CBS 118893]|uniref:Uncharacterized protein n=1 Tax=Arthroderma gypseum (strain ATCC MYA-4604 / CBS 118893) TaxID=535722 RepID=E4UVR3_ARTGP|nr:hypothetical protein MGYG_05386 [Nannizzia gypsea CBS 118893]EFR02390.1 hypothetical protein MGYG_05386 [Nannizzia gypsea CBS 118893]